MGGDAFTPLSYASEEGSSDGHDFGDPPLSSEFPHFLRDDLRMKVEDVTVGDAFGQSDQVNPPFLTSLELQGDRQRHKVYAEVSQTYEHLQLRGDSFNEAKSKILSYVPGAWIENVGGVKRDDYNVPGTTTLILIGPKGSGKSSLVNRISRVIEDDKFGPDRAQVSYMKWTGSSSIGDGTCFLQEYMIPRGSTSFCLYDTRSLSDKTSENIDTVKHWMTKGVRHGELVIRQSDSSSFRRIMEHKCPRKSRQSGVLRVVNFVIFVVDAVNILKSMEVGGNKETTYMEMITTTFSCPYLSFRDDKPVVVITHGDLLSLAERIRVRVHLGELLGIPPATQIFDIPDNSDQATELTIVDMLRYSLEHADRNFPCKDLSLHKVHRSSRASCRYLLLVLVIVVISILIHQHMDKRRTKNSELHIDWHAIRHLWLGLDN